MEVLEPHSNEQKKEYRVLFSNFISLVFLQGAHYILPLITIPYLVRVLQPDLFGLVSGAQYLMQYFITLTDYGFQFSATRLISIHRDNKEKLSQILSAVMLIRFSLLILAFLLVLLLISVSKHYSEEAFVYLLTFGMVIGNVLFPTWFFQGMEKMKAVTIINVISKIIFAAGIFIFVQERSDYYLVPVFQSLGFIVAGLLSLIVLLRTFPVRFIWPGVTEIRTQLGEGWNMFTSTVATTIYVNSNGFMLDLFADRVYVGYYAAGEKLIRAVASLFIPVSTAIYPYLSRKFHLDRKAGFEFFFKVLFYVGIVSFLVAIIAFFFGQPLALVVLGSEFSNTNEVIRWLAFIPFVGTIGALFAYQLFANIGWQKRIPLVLFSACILNLTLNYLLIPEFRHIGASMALMITEIYVPFVFICIWIAGRKKVLSESSS